MVKKQSSFAIYIHKNKYKTQKRAKCIYLIVIYDGKQYKHIIKQRAIIYVDFC